MHFEGVIPAVAHAVRRERRAWTPPRSPALPNGCIDRAPTGLVGNGTMGEAQSLSASERRLVIETLVAAAGGRVTVTAGRVERDPRAPRSATPRTPRRRAPAR